MPATAPHGRKASTCPSPQHVALSQPREIEGRVAGMGQRDDAAGRLRRLDGLGRRVRIGVPRRRRGVDDQQGPALMAQLGRLLPDALGQGAAAGVDRDAQQVEDVGLEETVDAGLLRPVAQELRFPQDGAVVAAGAGVGRGVRRAGGGQGAVRPDQVGGRLQHPVDPARPAVGMHRHVAVDLPACRCWRRPPSGRTGRPRSPECPEPPVTPRRRWRRRRPPDARPSRSTDCPRCRATPPSGSARRAPGSRCRRRRPR